MTVNIGTTYNSSSIAEFTYLENGDKLTEINYSVTDDGTAIPKYGFEYTYNENGKLIKKTTLLYDDAGNITNRIPMDVNVR